MVVYGALPGEAWSGGSCSRWARHFCADGMAGEVALTVRAGGDVGAVGAEDACQAKVGQLADVAARVLLRGLGALDQHVGALQVAAQQQRCSASQPRHYYSAPAVVAPFTYTIGHI